MKSAATTSSARSSCLPFQTVSTNARMIALLSSNARRRRWVPPSIQTTWAVVQSRVEQADGGGSRFRRRQELRAGVAEWDDTEFVDLRGYLHRSTYADNVSARWALRQASLRPTRDLLGIATAGGGDVAPPPPGTPSTVPQRERSRPSSGNADKVERPDLGSISLRSARAWGG